jgi:signal transduction histidine kinase
VLRPRSARSWLLELSLAAIATLLGFFFTHQSVSEGGGAPVAYEAAAGVLSFAALVLFRRSHPVLLTVALIPAGIFLGMPMGATPIALFAVGLHRPPRFAASLAAAHAVLVAVIYALAIGLTREYYETVAFLVLLHVSLVAVALLIRSQRQLIDSWAERARQAEEGQRLRVEQARLAERERIAREMHDVLAHRISLLAVHAGALEVRRGAPPAEQQAAGVIRQCAHDALEDLRTVIGMLRTPTGEAADAQAGDRPQPTLGDVPALVEQSREAGAEVGLSLAAGDGFPHQMGRHAYRIVQEALTNARKHAPGAPVRVEISGCAQRGLTVEIDNALAPGGAIPGAGAGLAGLRERVQLVGGRIEHGPTPSGEFRLRAWLPWHA